MGPAPGPISSIWKKWSAKVNIVAPASSAATAACVTVGASRSGAPGKKSMKCTLNSIA